MPKAEIRILNDYRLVYEPGHPKSMKSENWNGYIYEHILVAEKSLGRQLAADEVVHHLDFNRMNNRKENLLVLLMSQHSKLHGWLNSCGLGNGVANAVVIHNPLKEVCYCAICGRTLQSKQLKYCSRECTRNLNIQRVSKRPSKSELAKDIQNMSYVSVGKKYGVSDTSIRKWARAYGIEK